MNGFALEIIFSPEADQWIQAGRVSRELVTEAIHAPTSVAERGDGDVYNYRTYKWFSDDLIIHVAGVALDGDYVLGATPTTVKRLTVIAVARLKKSGPVPGIWRGMKCRDIELALMRVLGMKLTVEQVHRQKLRSMQFDGEPAVFARPPGQGVFALTLSRYREAFDSMHVDVLNLPAVAAAIATRPYNTSASDSLRRKCVELMEIIDKEANSEEELHQWLARRENHVFLDPTAVAIRSKLPFGDTVSDFIVERSDGTFVLVEIERANHRIFSNKGEPLNPVTHAIQQVRDWQRYIRDNVHTVRTELGLKDIDQPRGMIVIGRAKTLYEPLTGKARQKARNTWRDMKSRDPIPSTYDDLIAAVRALADQIEIVERQASPL